MTKIGGVYVIVNAVNGRRYVGSSADTGHRWIVHLSVLRRGEHYNAPLQRDWDEYGEQAFRFAVLIEEDDADRRLVLEQAVITADGLSGTGYNLFNTSHLLAPGLKPPRSDHGNSGRPKSSEHRANLWLNREVTPDHRERMRQVGLAGRGRPKSAEHRAAIGAAQQGSLNHAAKLTEPQVQEIRRRLAAGETGRALAREFGVSEATMTRIKKGQRYGFAGS